MRTEQVMTTHTGNDGAFATIWQENGVIYVKQDVAVIQFTPFQAHIVGIQLIGEAGKLNPHTRHAKI